MLRLQYKNIWGWGSNEKCQDIPIGFEYAKIEKAKFSVSLLETEEQQSALRGERPS